MMILPPGTLAALKGQTDAIVVVVVLVVSLGAMEFGVSPSGAIVAMVAALGMYHIRTSAKERHDATMAHRSLEDAALAIEAVKAPHRAALGPRQQALPFGEQPGQTRSGGRRGHR